MTLKERYTSELIPVLQKELHIMNRMAVPRVEQIVVSVRLSAKNKDAKLKETAEETLKRITGQKSVETKAKKSIAGFKIREGMVVGLKVTLRGERMWSFLEKLIGATLPRIRDFRGVPTSRIDMQGNLALGFQEHLAFPEIRPDEVERVHGLQVTIATTAGSRDHGLSLFRALGFPFQQS